jgi:tetratricopeptide (TPR) repeat protein
MTLAEYDARFPEKGEDAFRDGDYLGAVYYWRHALLDDPQNPVLVMMLGQALFATGAYNEAAGATQAAMHALPSDQWGVVVVHFRELYGNAADYTDQLRALERAVAEKPDDPARHFLAGFHYGHLGFPQQAIIEIEKALTLEPRDEMARQLRDELHRSPRALPPQSAPDHG